jgi:predicted 2-oxoglutarate/Fe(II)-dependent dioxygenase YbiX
VPTSEFFARLGLFTRPAFLERDLCASIRLEAAGAERRPAKIVDDQGNKAVEPDYRSSKRVQLTSATVELLEHRFLSVKPELEEHFRLSLTLRSPMHALEYAPGDFFVPHIDTLGHSAEKTHERLVSAVLFLNAATYQPAADGFGGGALVFYGLLKNAGAEAVGFPLVGEAGLFVAFKSEIVHEVQPVLYGRRFTVVGWYG